MLNNPNNTCVVIIGGGPAGLMAAEVLSQAGLRVAVYDAMPSVGRKFLLAGRGGLNLTHSEPLEPFLDRYGSSRPQIEPLLAAFGPDQLRAWAADLGVETFIGSSGRVFPTAMKASPLLRAWLARLQANGVAFHLRHRWQGWQSKQILHDGSLRFMHPDGELSVSADAVVLALGGGSWSRLGSDGAWVPLLTAKGIEIAPLKPANCGFDVAWSEHFRSRFAGEPVKTVVLSFADSQGRTFARQGEFVITETGVEGSLIYAVSALLRDELVETVTSTGSVTVSTSSTGGSTSSTGGSTGSTGGSTGSTGGSTGSTGGSTGSTGGFHLDLLPDRSQTWLHARLAKPRGSRSLSSHLQSRVGLKGVKAGLLREFAPADVLQNPAQLAAMIKALPIPVLAPRPLDEAISTAGGVMFEALDENLMLRALPGVFCAGEMLDWEAPTGGYLLTACFASGYAAGHGALKWLQTR